MTNVTTCCSITRSNMTIYDTLVVCHKSHINRHKTFMIAPTTSCDRILTVPFWPCPFAKLWVPAGKLEKQTAVASGLETIFAHQPLGSPSLSLSIGQAGALMFWGGACTWLGPCHIAVLRLSIAMRLHALWIITAGHFYGPCCANRQSVCVLHHYGESNR